MTFKVKSMEPPYIVSGNLKLKYISLGIYFRELKIYVHAKTFIQMFHNSPKKKPKEPSTE